MITVLVVEDDANKARNIETVLRRALMSDSLTVRCATNANAAGALLKASEFDLLVLDLNIPLREGEEPRADGGLRLLEQIKRRMGMRAPKNLVGLTAYDTLLDSQLSMFDREQWRIIKYDPTESAWEDYLIELVRSLGSASNDLSGVALADLAIVTALYRVELEAVLKLPAAWSDETPPGDHTKYHRGQFERDGRKLRVVAAACSEMGMPAATALSMKIIERFRPRYIAMVGIAAGVEGSFGDILVADSLWDYGSGKFKSAKGGRASIFLPAPSYIPLDQDLRTKLNYFSMNGEVMSRILSRWVEPRPILVQPRVGPMASGAAVLANRKILDDIRLHNRRLIGIEMESYGVFVAAREAREPRPRALSLKSVCDFADRNKGDDHQRFAAFTSANFLYEFALSHLAAS